MPPSPFGFDHPKDSPGFLLWQTTTLWQRRIRKVLEPHNLSHAQFVIMAQILWLSRNQEKVAQLDIVKMSKLDKMTVSTAMKKLEKLKFVTRRENLQDTRAKNVVLTEIGEEKVRRLVPMIEGVDGAFFSALNNLDQAMLIKNLRQLTREKDDI